jgi:diaminopimelate epimerase
MTRFPFVKMEGCGNDYVFIDTGLTPEAVEESSLGEPAEWVPRIADRHHGVGSDGLILLSPGVNAPVRMRMWNADGSEGRLCLNGLRCAAKYAAEAISPGEEFAVETAAGERRVRVTRSDRGTVEKVEVEAGTADFRRTSIPVTGDSEELWGELFYLGGLQLPGYGVSVGNPHLVLWMEEEEAVWRASLREIGEPFHSDPRFPEGVNVHLVSPRRGSGLVMRSWERGSGETLACGSGAVAAFAVARRLEKIPEQSAVVMPGGRVVMSQDSSGALVMRGPAREVFRGEVDVQGG